MRYKEKFDILKSVPNVFKLNLTQINKIRVSDATLEQAESMLKLASTSVKHFSSPCISLLSQVIKKKTSPVVLVVLPDYPLISIYNITTKQSLLNLSAFKIHEIIRIPIRNLYAASLYALTLKYCIDEVVPNEVITLVASFYLSIFIKLFGKKYGFLASYSSLIPDLKYILTVYTAVSLFGLKQTEDLYKKCAASSNLINYTKYDLSVYDFKSFESVIRSLNDLQIFPGFNSYEFISKVNFIFGIQLIPMFEDLTRLLSTIISCDIPGNSIFPSFIKNYNKSVYNSLLILTNRTIIKNKHNLQALK